MAVICVDISKWQPGFNMAQFKNSGGLGVILKASEGTTIKDSQYETHRKNALAAGLRVATYHFFRGNSVSEADWYLKCANPVQGERVVCDWEVTSQKTSSVVNFLKYIQSCRPDLQLTVYSGHVAKENIAAGGDAWLRDNTSLWIAQYSSKVSWRTDTWPQWSLWQYSETGRVPGYNDNVDCNRFNGSDENFLKWMGPAEQPAPIEPEPPTEPEEPEADIPVITMNVTADRPVHIVINGQVIEIEQS